MQKKVAAIFAKFDLDGDNKLKHAEATELQHITEGAAMSETDYEKFCKLLGADPKEGFSVQQLLFAYIAHGEDIDADHAAVFPGQGR